MPRLRDLGWTIEIYLISHRGINAHLFEKQSLELTGPGAKITYKTTKNIVKKALFLVRNVYLLNNYLLSHKHAIVHFYLPEAYIIGGISAIFTKHKVTLMSRRSLNIYQSKYPFINKVESLLHKRMKYLIANSKAVANDLKNEEVDEKKIKVIYNGVDINKFTLQHDSLKNKKELELNNNTIVFVMVANLIAYKGHADVIKAFNKIKDDLPPWKLLIIGRDDGIGNALKSLAKECDIENNILWLGQRADIAKMLSLSDVAMLCSHEEGFSNSILEAMAAGLPMIVTDVGGNKEAVLDGITGLVVAAHDIDAISESMLYLAREKHIRISMGNAARERACAHFSIDNCVKKYNQLYTNLYEEFI